MTGAPPDGRHGPHVLVESVDLPVVAADDRHHLDRVLRMRDGDEITVGDGAGRWRPCRWGPTVEPVGDVVEVARPSPRLGVAFALIKAGRPELVVQKLVELGVDDIRPFAAERSVVRWDDAKAAKNAQRLERVAREAVMQCRRAWLPVVHPVATFDDVVALPGAARADMGGGAVRLEHPLVLVGPEGGWTDAERAVDLPTVSLSTAVLRAETAAITAGVLLAALRDLDH
ncbi:MAG: RsmE family RNA methyltransferase [Actinomycetota bacterium]